MVSQISIAILALAIVIPVGIFYLGERKAKRFKRMLGVNLVSFAITFVVATLFIFANGVSAADTAAGGDMSSGLAFIGAALATGLGSLGAGIATGQAASSALGALSENEGIMGKALIFVALAEGIAIYGLIISVMILGYLS